MPGTQSLLWHTRGWAPQLEMAPEQCSSTLTTAEGRISGMVFGTAVEASTVYPGLDISCTNSAQCQHSRSAPCVCSGWGGHAQPHAPGCAPSLSTQQLQAPSLQAGPCSKLQCCCPKSQIFPCARMCGCSVGQSRGSLGRLLGDPSDKGHMPVPVFPSTHVSQQKSVHA